jgi:DNA-binding LytR/AlgR family response regulator
MVTCKGLAYYQRILPTLFLRCHHSHIINLSKVVKLAAHDGYHVELASGVVVSVARRRWFDVVLALTMPVL